SVTETKESVGDGPGALLRAHGRPLGRRDRFNHYRLTRGVGREGVSGGVRKKQNGVSIIGVNRKGLGGTDDEGESAPEHGGGLWKVHGMRAAGNNRGAALGRSEGRSA